MMTVAGVALVLGLLDAAPLGSDATFGRIEGDVTLSLGVGATIGPRGVRANADFRLRFLDSVGIFFGYEEGFGSAEPTRVLYTGLELRPLFLGRWLQGLEMQRSFGDLLIDSFGLELGGFALQPQNGAIGDRLGLQLGLGLEVPIMARASGLWIGFHGGIRYSDLGLARGEETALDRAGYLSITLAWHQVVGVHLVDAGDESAR